MHMTNLLSIYVRHFTCRCFQDTGHMSTGEMGVFCHISLFFPVFTYFLVYHFGSAEALHRSEDEYLMIPVEQQHSELSFSSSLSDQSAHEFREAVSYEGFRVWVEVSFSLIVLSSGSVSPLRGKYPPFFSSLSRRVLPYGSGPVESFS